MKRYLITMGVLLGLALMSGIIVWYLYQDLNPRNLIEVEPQIIVPQQNSTSTDDHTASETAEGDITISADSLSERQKDALEAFGLDGMEYTVTAPMIACAEAELGDQRFDEIINGAAPTPLEALSLVPCMKAR